MTNILLFVTVTALFTTILGTNPGNHYTFAQEGPNSRYSQQNNV